MSMLISKEAIALFVRAMHLWLGLFLGYCLCSEPVSLWLEPVSPLLTYASGPVAWLVYVTSGFGYWFWLAIPCATVFLALYSAFKRPVWYLSLVLWAAYVVLIARGWMVSTGGQQLIAIQLLWCIPLSTNKLADSSTKQFAGWAARMQLVLVYLSTFLHKINGADWVSGQALTILSTDPTFHLGFLQGFPMLAIVLTYMALGFQLFFAVGIWVPFLRRFVLLAGVLFHLATAWAIEIPDMALAFIMSYSIWLSTAEIRGIPAQLRKALSL